MPSPPAVCCQDATSAWREGAASIAPPASETKPFDEPDRRGGRKLMTPEGATASSPKPRRKDGITDAYRCRLLPLLLVGELSEDDH